MGNQSGSDVAIHAVKLAGEAIVIPGSSQLLDGDIVGGGAHAVAGVVAGFLIGPVGWIVVAADSYSKSVSDKHLHEHFTGSRRSVSAPTEPEAKDSPAPARNRRRSTSSAPA